MHLTPSPKIKNFFKKNSGQLIGKYFSQDRVSLDGLKPIDFLYLRNQEMRSLLLKNLLFNVRLYYLNDQFHKAYNSLTECVDLIQGSKKLLLDSNWAPKTLFTLHNYRLMIHFLRQIKQHHRKKHSK